MWYGFLSPARSNQYQDPGDALTLEWQYLLAAAIETQKKHFEDRVKNVSPVYQWIHFLTPFAVGTKEQSQNSIFRRSH